MMQCTDCFSEDIVEDRSQGDLICTSCGLVLQSHMISEEVIRLICKLLLSYSDAQNHDQYQLSSMTMGYVMVGLCQLHFNLQLPSRTLRPRKR